MRITGLVKKILALSTATGPHRNWANISKLTGAKLFYQQVAKQPSTLPSSNAAILGRLTRYYWGLSLLVVLLSICGIVTMVLQPYINDFLKQTIQHKFQDPNALWIIMGVYLGFKIIGSLLDIVSDYCSMILGTKFYSTMTHHLLGPLPSSAQITCLEDDSERLQNLPSSSTTSATKILQFVAFSSILISRLPTFQLTVAAIYWIFFTICMILAAISSRINIKMMAAKQRRIRTDVGVDVIRTERDKELKGVKQLMIVNGIGIMLPWLLNVVLMVLIYGIVGMPKDEKYFILTIFGLLRTSISGLGTNFNYFAQAWSSLYRISSFLQKSQEPPNPQPSQPLHQPLTSPSSTPTNQPIPPSTHPPTLPSLLRLLYRITPLFPMLLVLFLVLLSSNFLYNYFLKSIIIGQSVFLPFNLVCLGLSFMAPLCLFAFVCFSNICLSKTVYQRLLGKQGQQGGQGAEVVNRLVGDIRLLDRQLYGSVYGMLAHVASIAASFIYSIVILNNLLTSGLLVLVIVIALWLCWLSTRFITLRKQVYRKQAINKGKILQNLLSTTTNTSSSALAPASTPSLQQSWCRVYSYKYLGFSIQLTFITLMYIIIIVCSCIIIVVVLLSPTTTEQSSILIMQLSQLDYQFLMLFVQVVMMQTAIAAVARCFDLIVQVENGRHQRQEGEGQGEGQGSERNGVRGQGVGIGVGVGVGVGEHEEGEDEDQEIR